MNIPGMVPLTPPAQPSVASDIEMLTGIDNWHSWRMHARTALKNIGLDHLLTHDPLTGSLDADARSRYAVEREAAVGLVAERISPGILAAARARGWDPATASVQSTNDVLEAVMFAEEQRRRDEDASLAAARRQMAGLTRAAFAQDRQTIREYVLEAKHRHDDLLTYYTDGGGGGAGSPATVEDVLEQLFVTALLEGIKKARPAWYREWMGALEEGGLGRTTMATTPTRAGVTAWLLAKDKAAREAQARQPAQAPVVMPPTGPKIMDPGRKRSMSSAFAPPRNKKKAAAQVKRRADCWPQVAARADGNNAEGTCRFQRGWQRPVQKTGSGCAGKRVKKEKEYTDRWANRGNYRR